MKFILNEKFILEERFILTEASVGDLKSAIDKVDKTITKIIDQKLISQLKGLLGGEVDAAENKSVEAIEKAAEEVSDQFDAGQKDLSIIKGKINAYLDLLIAEINKSNSSTGSVLNSLPGIKSLIAKLRADLEENPINDADSKKLANNLKNDFSKINDTISSGLATTGSEVTDGSVNAELVDEKVSKIIEIRNKITGINKVSDPIIKNLNEFDQVLESNFEELSKLINTGLKAEKREDREAAGENASDILDSIADECSKLENAISFDKISATKHDWQKDLDNAAATGDPKRVNQIWEEYYKKEWGKDAEKVKGLGQTFRTELLKGGFSEQVNPFVTFVKNNINSLNLNGTTYPAVHNAYVEDYITKSDLRNNSNNLLYNKALYGKQPKEILEYLGRQIAIRNAFDSSKLIEAAKDIYESDDEVAAAIFDAAVNITANKFPRAQTVDLRNIRELKTLEQIKNCMAYCFPRVSFSSTYDKTDITTDKLISALKDKSIDPKKVIKYLAMKANSSANKLLDFVDNKQLGEMPDEQDVKNIEVVLANYNLKNVKQLIKNLAIAANIAKEEDLKD